MRLIVTALIAFLYTANALGQTPEQSQVLAVWSPDQGDGTFANPIIHADYSDPDVCVVGDDFYMTASSFNVVPGLPLLHSKDLVNWKLVGHALPVLHPLDHFRKVQHGNGVWAPAIRFHDNEFYIYYPDPDFGIYLTKARDIKGPWSEPVLVQEGKGLIDPCPLWDDDGRVFLVHAFAGSRAGIKSIIVVKELTKDGTQVVGAGRIVYDGHRSDPTIEGPKFYKRNNYYYIFAPAGGVSTGWQLVLRSRNVFGPYERKVVMDQGSTHVNGPHQGAWVATPKGEDWFIHFQDKEEYGRIVHLQPMRWIDDWPVIGDDKDGDGKGQPVERFKKPKTTSSHSVGVPATSDEFNGEAIGLQWQWQANPEDVWMMAGYDSQLRLYAADISNLENFKDVPNLLLQKLPAEEFMVTTRMTFQPNTKNYGERAGLILIGSTYATISLRYEKDGMKLVYASLNELEKKETENIITSLKDGLIFLRFSLDKRGAVFAYSTDGKTFTTTGEVFKPTPGKWIGAKMGLFCTRTVKTNDSGYADFDWFHVEKIKK